MQTTCLWAEFMLLMSHKVEDPISDALEICEVFNAVVPLGDVREAHIQELRWHDEDEVTLTAELNRDVDL